MKLVRLLIVCLMSLSCTSCIFAIIDDDPEALRVWLHITNESGENVEVPQFGLCFPDSGGVTGPVKTDYYEESMDVEKYIKTLGNPFVFIFSDTDTVIHSANWDDETESYAFFPEENNIFNSSSWRKEEGTFYYYSIHAR